jgi:hypothetical protein
MSVRFGSPPGRWCQASPGTVESISRTRSVKHQPQQHITTYPRKSLPAIRYVLKLDGLLSGPLPGWLLATDVSVAVGVHRTSTSFDRKFGLSIVDRSARPASRQAEARRSVRLASPNTQLRLGSDTDGRLRGWHRLTCWQAGRRGYGRSAGSRACWRSPPTGGWPAASGTAPRGLPRARRRSSR